MSTPGPGTGEEEPEGPAAIRVEGLRKAYGEVTAVAGLDLTIPPGRFIGLLGPNGSGKTTTMHVLATLVRPGAGRVRVAGHDVEADPVEVRRAIGLVFQESALDRNLTVQENLDFTAALYNLSPARIAERVDELLDLFGLTDRRDTQVAHLSGGMRRALDIIRGVLHRPRILLLDEPTIGLDVLNRRFIWRYLERLREEEGMTVLLTTHYLEEAEPCDWVTFLREGRAIGSGTPTEMLGAIGAYILEVTGAEEGLIEELRTRLGDPVQEGDRHLFRVRDPDTPLGDLEAVLRPRVRSILVRQPDLNDVYIWLNRSRTEGFGA